MTVGSSGGEVLEPSFVSEPTFVRTLEGLIESLAHKPTGESIFCVERVFPLSPLFTEWLIY